MIIVQLQNEKNSLLNKEVSWMIELVWSSSIIDLKAHMSASNSLPISIAFILAFIFI